MAALDFPATPTVGDVYTANGRSWEWNGESWISGGGASATLPQWLEGHPDTPPASANTEDDEFESATLNAKWTETLTSTPTIDIHTTQKSHYWAKLTAAGQAFAIKQTAPTGTGTFSITAKAYLGPDNATNTLFLGAYGSGTQNMYAKLQQTSVGGNWLYGMLEHNTGFTDLGQRTMGVGTTHIYMHLQRLAANAWEVWGSFDGRAWWLAATRTFSFTVTQIGMGVSAAGAGTARTRVGIDWFRRDWLTL